MPPYSPSTSWLLPPCISDCAYDWSTDFGGQKDPSRRPLGPGLMMIGGIVIAIAVGIQYLLFRSH